MTIFRVARALQWSAQDSLTRFRGVLSSAVLRRAVVLFWESSESDHECLGWIECLCVVLLQLRRRLRRQLIRKPSAEKWSSGDARESLKDEQLRRYRGDPRRGYTKVPFIQSN